MNFFNTVEANLNGISPELAKFVSNQKREFREQLHSHLPQVIQMKKNTLIPMCASQTLRSIQVREADNNGSVSLLSALGFLFKHLLVWISDHFCKQATEESLELVKNALNECADCSIDILNELRLQFICSFPKSI